MPQRGNFIFAIYLQKKLSAHSHCAHNALQHMSYISRHNTSPDSQHWEKTIAPKMRAYSDSDGTVSAHQWMLLFFICRFSAHVKRWLVINECGSVVFSGSQLDVVCSVFSSAAAAWVCFVALYFIVLFMGHFEYKTNAIQAIRMNKTNQFQ